jgi:DNA-directed RNA polymerase
MSTNKILEQFPDFSDENSNEKEMAQMGSDRAKKRLRSHVERGEESITSYGKVFVSNAISPLAIAIAEWIEETRNKIVTTKPVAFTKICTIPVEILALITAKSIVNTISKHSPLTSSAIVLGGLIEVELELNNFKELNPSLYETVRRDLDKRSFSYTYKQRKLKETVKRDETVTWTKFTVSEKLHVGLRLIELLVETTGLVEIVMQTYGHKRANMIKPTEKTKAWISDRNSFNSLLTPDYQPMVMLPQSWTEGKLFGGGYHTKHLPSLPLIKARVRFNPNYKEDAHGELEDMPDVYSAVNSLQAVPYKINKFVLKTLETIWDKGAGRGGVPSIEDKIIPNKPLDINTNEVARKDWKRQAVVIHTENKRCFSKRLLYAKIIYLAGKFKDFASIYFPLQVDFRGRAYCIPPFLNYQGIDGAKGMLSFAKGKPITIENGGIKNLAIFGSNMFGNDKVTFEEREQWTKDNEAMILRCAGDPIQNREWEDASKPFQFLGFCDEWARYLKEGEGFISYIVVSVDGSCNGLQIYSLLLKDKLAGELVNLMPSNKPQDVYQRVADEVNDKLKEEATEGVLYAQQWLDFGVTRSTTKRTIMTICYGSTRFATCDFVIEDIRKRADKGEGNPFENNLLKPASYLAKIIWGSIGDNLKSARMGMAFLQNTVGVVAKSQRSITWTTPVGFKVVQKYPETKTKRVRAILFGETMRPRVRSEIEKLDKGKNRRSVAPNYVHSLDAAAMFISVNNSREEGLTNFCGIHDSFGTNACDVDILNKSIRKAFIKLFADTDLFQKFKDDVTRELPLELMDKLPKLPTKGDLDIGLLDKADFFFA